MSKLKLGNYTKIKTGKLDANASVENGKYPFFRTRKACHIKSKKGTERIFWR